MSMCVGSWQFENSFGFNKVCIYLYIKTQLVTFPSLWSWISLLADDAVAEDENEENPFSTEFQEDQEAAYLKDPKKALQGFYDREGLTLLTYFFFRVISLSAVLSICFCFITGEELEFEYEEKGSGTWLCRIK